ncbi:MAG: tripartite tricarboxylate transporter substrate binding protein [Proteobacteria bacterium]|nr:tripartite tricarboxylate transporter substrate binding protein [Burkholderiales bacterium]
MNPAIKGAALTAACSLSMAALAQDFPNRPVRIVVPFSAGSATDILARTAGARLTEIWGHQVLTDNRPGALGIVGTELMLKSNPDGHTLLMVSSGHAANATLAAKLPFDTIKDFSGIAPVAIVPNVMVVSPSLGVKNVRDLVELAKKRPNGLLFASAGIGSSTHLNGEVVRTALGIKAQHVPFKGVPEGLTDILGGRVDFFMVPLVASMNQIKAGKLLGLAVGTNKRSTVLPDLPTLVETFPGAGFDGWFGLLASSKTPRPLVDRLNRDVNKVLALPEVRDLFLTQGAETMSMSAEQFDKFLAAEVVRLGKVVKESGAKAE